MQIALILSSMTIYNGCKNYFEYLLNIKITVTILQIEILIKKNVYDFYVTAVDGAVGDVGYSIGKTSSRL